MRSSGLRPLAVFAAAVCVSQQAALARFAITTSSLSNATENTGYSQQLTTNAQQFMVLAWTIAKGALPPGLTLGPVTAKEKAGVAIRRGCLLHDGRRRYDDNLERFGGGLRGWTHIARKRVGCPDGELAGAAGGGNAVDQTAGRPTQEPPRSPGHRRRNRLCQGSHSGRQGK